MPPLIAQPREGYFTTGNYDVLRDKGPAQGGLIPTALGASTVWIFPAFASASLIPIILTALSAIILIAGISLMVRNPGERGLILGRKYELVGITHDLNIKYINHPKVQEALQDWHYDANKYDNAAHWRDEFGKLNLALMENARLIANEKKETLPSGYHIAVEAHNEMLKPHAIVAEVEEKKEERKPAPNPTTFGVSLHLKTKELDQVKWALLRDPNYKELKKSDLYRRILKAEAKVSELKEIEAPVEKKESKCTHPSSSGKIGSAWMKCEVCKAVFNQENGVILKCTCDSDVETFGEPRCKVHPLDW